ncbi:DUF5665 domain-containing protein [Paenibacillus sp. GCM10028914]|uniref:DUF5665 domain-containing protein n=1 Tax=Paenibacillus sp. GCM10028914 TaxID=3273416 RepID=UPI00360B1270
MGEQIDEKHLSSTDVTRQVENEADQLSKMYLLTEKIANQLEKSRIGDYAQLLHRPWKLIGLNLLAGSAKGVGIAIGFTFFAATIIYLLQALGALNLPIIGDYIADIVRIVQRQLELT